MSETKEKVNGERQQVANSLSTAEQLEVEDPSLNLNDEEGERHKNTRLAYGVDDVPPWYMCILLGFQVGIWMTW